MKQFSFFRPSPKLQIRGKFIQLFFRKMLFIKNRLEFFSYTEEKRIKTFLNSTIYNALEIN